MPRTKTKGEKREWFIVLGEQGYFTGFSYGGKTTWSPDLTHAKPLDDLSKLRTLQTMQYGEELIFDYI